ncbi:hypothetical protein ACUY1T_14535 [Billgrantia sp. Q4P2]|uniref:hypothetical protein n=1 Tax=Billgrantia sp. Q4P2 TaxID=3463857 RepID=UPI0040576ACC
MKNTDLALSIQRALLGEVPPTLRFLYAHIDNGTLHYRAVFTDDAIDDHLECASVALTEIIADLPSDIQLEERIERDSSVPW